MNLTPELTKRLEAINCLDYGEYIVIQAKTIAEVETIINFMQLAWHQGKMVEIKSMMKSLMELNQPQVKIEEEN